MHDGLVHSCNAYFAQLAVSSGPSRSSSIADGLKILAVAEMAIPPSWCDSRFRRSGMARRRSSHRRCEWRRSPRPWRPMAFCAAVRRCRTPPSALLDRIRAAMPNRSSIQRAARQLARFMRDVVVDGTGRSLRSHAWPIAGKTGTAEVSGRPSHGWFVGFAPYGSGGR